MKPKRLVLILLLAAAVGGIVYALTRKSPSSIELTGIVTTDAVVASSQIAGQVDSLLVKEGDQVKRGELLAVISAGELKADAAYYAHAEEGTEAQVENALAALRFQEKQTRDQITQAEAALASTKAQHVEAMATLEQARLDYERAQGLFKQGIVSTQANDQARTTYEAAKAHVESLNKQIDVQVAAVALARSTEDQIAIREADLRAGRHQVAAAGAQKKAAEVRLGYTEIRSPIDGLVSLRAALEGEVVNPGQPIVTLIDPDDLWVRTDVEETYVDLILLGEKMMVRFPSGDKRLGTVFYRGVDADYATQRDVSRAKRDIKTFEVRMRVDNKDRHLYPGMTAYVSVPLAAAHSE
jgi:HlyD family secretion protein